MLKVLAFMKQVATGLQMEGNFGTAHVYRSSLNAIIAYRCLLYTSYTVHLMVRLRIYVIIRNNPFVLFKK